MGDKDKEIRDAFSNINWGLRGIYEGIHTLEKYVDSKKGKDDIYHIYKELGKINNRIGDIRKILKFWFFNFLFCFLCWPFPCYN